MPTEFVRIRDTKNHTEVSVSRTRAEQLKARGAEILDGVPAVDGFGRPLPATQAQPSAKTKEQTR